MSIVNNLLRDWFKSIQSINSNLKREFRIIFNVLKWSLEKKANEE